MIQENITRKTSQQCIVTACRDYSKRRALTGSRRAALIAG